jgi:hypothetical protein
MSFTYGFYNSLNGDRKYDAIQFGQLFDGIINDGVFMSIGEHFNVEALEDMKVKVGTGRAWFNSTWSYNDSSIILPLSSSAALLNRIDLVILEVDASDATRTNTIKILEGTPASSPIAPTLINSEDEHLFQYALAEVYIGAGVTEITQTNITNKVGKTGCPYVTGILETINIDDLVAQWGSQWNEWMDEKVNLFDTAYSGWQTQWNKLISDSSTDLETFKTEQETGFSDFRTEQQQLFNTWFANIQYTLSGDAAAKLQAQIDNLKETFVSMTLSASKWSSGEYSLESTYPAATYNLYISVPNTATLEQVVAWNSARILANTSSNVLIAMDTTPTVDIPIFVKVVKK